MIRLLQCLCANGHHIFAAAYDDQGEGFAELTQDQIKVGFRSLVAQACRERVAVVLHSPLPPWCVICHSTSENWRYEDVSTVYSSLQEAAPILRKLAVENLFATSLIFREGENTNNHDRH